MNGSRFCILLYSLMLATTARAETASASATGNAPGTPLTVQARLDFSVTIGKFIYFRIGNGGTFAGNTLTGARPTANSSINQVEFVVTPTIPGVPTNPLQGNQQNAIWNKTSPSFSTVASNQVLGVEVASNAGQVSLSSQTTTPLSSSSSTIAASDITISSSSAALPAPTILNSGISPAVTVATGGSGTTYAPGLLTYQTANWTFAYAASASTLAGTYNGQITFTASAP